VHDLRGRGLDVTCLDARHARAALKMQINKTGRNNAEGLAQIMRTGWYRAVHVKSLDAHRACVLLGARAQLVGMTTRLSNHVRGVLKTFGLLPGAMRGAPFERRVEVLLAGRDDLAPIVQPMLAAWRQLREQVAAFDKEVRALAKQDPTCRLLMSVPGIVSSWPGAHTVLPRSAPQHPWILRSGVILGGARAMAWPSVPMKTCPWRLRPVASIIWSTLVVMVTRSAPASSRSATAK
jgi:hypothetical protein